jgi:hypothetical protein
MGNEVLMKPEKYEEIMLIVKILEGYQKENYTEVQWILYSVLYCGVRFLTYLDVFIFICI